MSGKHNPLYMHSVPDFDCCLICKYRRAFRAICDIVAINAESLPTTTFGMIILVVCLKECLMSVSNANLNLVRNRRSSTMQWEAASR